MKIIISVIITLPCVGARFTLQLIQAQLVEAALYATRPLPLGFWFPYDAV